MIYFPAAALCAAAFAAPAGPSDGSVDVQIMTAPAPKDHLSYLEDTGVPDIPAGARVDDLVRGLIESWRPKDKAAYAERLGKTKPKDLDDLRSLLHLFNKEDLRARAAVRRCLGLLSPADRSLSRFFVTVLGYDEADLRLFGLYGAVQTRAAGALPLIEAIADREFSSPTPETAEGPKASREWVLRFSALDSLAEWKGASVLPLLEKRALEAPAVAGIMASYFWKEAFPTIVDWSRSRKENRRLAADEAWKASVAPESIRPTLPSLWEVLLEPRNGLATRHEAAKKLGLAAAEADVDRLLSLRSDPAKTRDRLLLDAALFASRSPKGVPILLEYAKAHKDPISRAGALAQLEGMLPPPEFNDLLVWVGKNDPDAENREAALKRLKSLKDRPSERSTP